MVAFILQKTILRLTLRLCQAILYFTKTGIIYTLYRLCET